MSNLGQIFSPQEQQQIEPQEFSEVPEGTYTAIIEKAEVQDTQSGEGTGVNITWRITGPTQQNRVTFDNIFLRHTNQKAEIFGRQKFVTLLKAIGLQSASDTNELINRQAKITLRHNDYTRENNKGPQVSKIEPFGGHAPQTQPQKATPWNQAPQAPPQQVQNQFAMQPPQSGYIVGQQVAQQVGAQHFNPQPPQPQQAPPQPMSYNQQVAQQQAPQAPPQGGYGNVVDDLPF